MMRPPSSQGGGPGPSFDGSFRSQILAVVGFQRLPDFFSMEASLMVSLRPIVSAVLLGLVGVGSGGCKKGESTQAKPEPSASANPRGKLNIRPPLAPQARMDPQATKDYRVELCEFGTLTLRYARDQYLQSLGKDEPSEKKLPSFGSTGAPTPPGAPPPGAPGAPPAKASGSAAPAGGPPGGPPGMPGMP